jgi:hypothetical protein
MPGIPYGPPKFKNMRLENRKPGNDKLIIEEKKEEEVIEAALENN